MRDEIKKLIQEIANSENNATVSKNFGETIIINKTDMQDIIDALNPQENVGSDANAVQMKTLKETTILSLKGIKIEKDALHLFFSALPNTNIISLDLSNCEINDSDAKNLLEHAVKPNSKIEVLVLNQNQITDQGAKEIATQVQKQESKIQILHLAKNQIQVEGRNALLIPIENTKNHLDMVFLAGNPCVVKNQGSSSLSTAAYQPATSGTSKAAGASATPGNHDLTQSFLRK